MTRMPEEIKALFRRVGVEPENVMSYTLSQDFSDDDIPIIEVQLYSLERMTVQPPENPVTIEQLSEKLDRVIEANNLFMGT